MEIPCKLDDGGVLNRSMMKLQQSIRLVISWFDTGCIWSYILDEYDIHIRGKDGEFFGEGLVYLVGSR